MDFRAFFLSYSLPLVMLFGGDYTTECISYYSSEYDYVSPTQSGIIEIYPRVAGVKIRVNMDGDLKLFITNDLGQPMLNTKIKSYKWYEFNSLSKGKYYFKVISREGRVEQGTFTVK